jgi:hypothetical protein
MQRFLALGIECLEFWIAANESKGKQPDILSNLLCLFLRYLSLTWSLIYSFLDKHDDSRESTKALEESKTRLAPAEAKHTKEIATANHTATQAVKKAEAQAAKAKKSLAKVVQGQSQREEAAIERLNALSTSFSSNIFLPCDSGCHFLFKCVWWCLLR